MDLDCSTTSSCSFVRSVVPATNFWILRILLALLKNGKVDFIRYVAGQSLFFPSAPMKENMTGIRAANESDLPNITCPKLTSWPPNVRVLPYMDSSRV